MPNTKEDHERKPRLWRPVDRAIWAPGGAMGRLQRLAEGMKGGLTFIFFASLVVFGPLTVLLSVLFAYSLVGPTFFGPTLLATLSVLTVVFVIILEKTGYARHFESWEYKLTKERLIAVPIAFLIITIVMFMFYLKRIGGI